MAKVTSQAEQQPPPLDQRLEELATIASLNSRALRVRIQPDIYNYETGNYAVWTGLSWTFDLTDVEEGRRLREGLAAFFELFGKSPESQGRVLDMLRGMCEGDPRRA